MNANSTLKTGIREILFVWQDYIINKEQENSQKLQIIIVIEYKASREATGK